MAAKAAPAAAAFLLLALFTTGGWSLQCYSSNGKTRKATDPGVSVVCRDVAGATQRFCTLFKTESRPGKVFRECDNIYQLLYGADAMPISAGCRTFTATVGGIEETGVYCACSQDNCNDASDFDENTVMT